MSDFDRLTCGPSGFCSRPTVCGAAVAVFSGPFQPRVGQLGLVVWLAVPRCNPLWTCLMYREQFFRPSNRDTPGTRLLAMSAAGDQGLSGLVSPLSCDV